MCKELVKRLRYCADSDNQCSECKYRGGSPDGSKMCLDLLMVDAADAIEERDRYALTIQHEMMTEAESHIALVERLNKQIEELSKRIDRAVELYNHGVEKSAMYEALKGISPELPKEEA